MTDSHDAKRSEPPVRNGWWKTAVVYQVYPRSFADANGDGVGDVAGITSRLPYLRDLGVDAIWVCPWYRSPWNDGGYDVVDFRSIDERFGSVDDVESLIAAAHEHDIKVVVDIVPNHVSHEHRWFVDALAAGPGSPERERFWFRPGRGDGSLPPSDWQSVFGGSAWTRLDDGDWYLHLFDATQPDLNWSHPDVADEFDDILRFWLSRGVDGFRIDVAQGMAKDPDLPDTGVADPLAASLLHDHPFWNRDAVHEVARRWRRVIDAHRTDVALIAEAWVVPERMGDYTDGRQYDQVFNFDFLSMRWARDSALERIRRGIEALVDGVTLPTWTLSNHDGMRHATRFGLPIDTDLGRWPLAGPAELLDAGLGVRRARAATLMLMALPGSIYLYQGEELGLPDVWDLPIDAVVDPVFENSGRTVKGRDGCRVPIPWSRTGPSLGFGASAPWLPQPPRFAVLSVEAQLDDPASTLVLYRRALALRRAHARADEIGWIDLGPDIIAFANNRIRSYTNFGNRTIVIGGTLLVASAPVSEGELPASTTVWVSAEGT